MKQLRKHARRGQPAARWSCKTLVVSLGVFALLSLAITASQLYARPAEAELLPAPGGAVARVAESSLFIQDAGQNVKVKKAKARKKPAEPEPVAVATTPAVFKPAEPIKLAPKLDVTALAARIDQHLVERLNQDKILASSPATDAEFLRRAYLDIVGVIPSPEEAKAFLDDPTPTKRAKLIDQLLANEKYGEHFADIWQSLTLPRDSANRRLTAEPFVKWLKDNFNQNKPWHQMVGELLISQGPQNQNGAVTFFLANQTPDKFTDQTSRLFLGVQLQCAQCHNHPFTGWKQAEYWGMAQFFMKVRPDNVNRAAKMGASPGINESGKGKAKLPEGAMTVPAKFLQGKEVALSSSAPARPVLAQWLASANNPYFARAMVNRMWQHFMGRGFVTPVDDMHENNAASHPALLADLAEQFKASGFDLKHLIRAICSSQAYQRSSKPASDSDSATLLFAQMAVKPLTPEQLFDSLTQVVGRPTANERAVNKKMAARGGGNNPRAQFVNFFMTDEGADPTEYQSGIPQALRLMNSPQFNRPGGLFEKAMKTGATPAEVIETLYLGTLARRPTAEESSRLVAYADKAGANASDLRNAYSDILWALLNSSEFALNH